MRRFGYMIVGAAMGGLVCALIALLFAPSSGDKFRAQIKETSLKISQDVQQAAAQRRLELEQELANLRASASR
ncbi:MAG: YtxH domain-containing protein [Anaerolineaceae bacterium]|nr:YtxH domain-containing protein [Anaerolineaceae bacterium]